MRLQRPLHHWSTHNRPRRPRFTQHYLQTTPDDMQLRVCSMIKSETHETNKGTTHARNRRH